MEEVVSRLKSPFHGYSLAIRIGRKRNVFGGVNFSKKYRPERISVDRKGLNRSTNSIIRLDGFISTDPTKISKEILSFLSSLPVPWIHIFSS